MLQHCALITAVDMWEGMCATLVANQQRVALREVACSLGAWCNTHQTAIGILPRDQLEAEIRRVFKTLKGKRWIVCTSHFVQNHCSIDDLEFAFDLIYKLAREK